MLSLQQDVQACNTSMHGDSAGVRSIIIPRSDNNLLARKGMHKYTRIHPLHYHRNTMQQHVLLQYIKHYPHLRII
jgi:hypothetical protein